MTLGLLEFPENIPSVCLPTNATAENEKCLKTQTRAASQGESPLCSPALNG